MNAVLQFSAGYRTYIIAAVLVLVEKGLGIDVGSDWLTEILAALGVNTLRAGITWATSDWLVRPRPSVICLPTEAYDRAFQARLAEDIRRLASGTALKRAMLDYARLRDQARACANNGDISPITWWQHWCQMYQFNIHGF